MKTHPAIIGNLSPFQVAALSHAPREDDGEAPFFSYDDTWQVDPALLPSGAKFFPETGEAEYYVPSMFTPGGWNVIFKDLDGITKLIKNVDLPS